MAIVGEPWHSFFEPDSLIEDLKAVGFTQVENFGPAEINERFFRNRADTLMVGGFGRLMKARL
jgi:hypothetical protein